MPMSKTSPIWQPYVALGRGRVRRSAGAGLQEVCRRSAGGGLLESQLAEASGSRAAAFIALFATYYRSDLIAHDMESLREAVEELNGVSFRDS